MLGDPSGRASSHPEATLGRAHRSTRTYDVAMSELPASVRTALWATSLWAHGAGLDGLWDRAIPDLDAVGGDTSTLAAWGSLGEAGLLVALPHPGHPRMLPRCDQSALAEAVLARECLFSPMLGGLLIPRISTFGVDAAGSDDAPISLDIGHRIDWTFHDSDPLPVHSVTGIDVRDTRRRLLEAVLLATEELEAMGGTPFSSRAMALPQRQGDGLGLPHGIPEGCLSGISTAALISQASEMALAAPQDGLTAGVIDARERVLRGLVRTADHALEDFTNVAVAVLAGWRPA